MAQAVSYGSITIVDTNDIESITIEYARNQSTSNPPAQDSSDWSTTRPDWAQGYYIWQRARIHKSGTETSADTFGAAVCLTGSTGQSGTPGQSLTATKTQYTNAANNVTITENNHTSYTWTDSTPEYDATKPVYWGRITNTYTNPAKTEYLFYKDQALTDAIYNAYIANSIATHAQEDAEGALSQANSNINEVVRLWQAKSVHSTPNPPSTEVTTGSASTYNNWSTVKPTATDTYRYFYYCDQSKTGGGICTWSEVIEDTSYLSTYEINALNVRTKNFFKGKDATYDGWFASGRTEDEGLRDNDAETYLYNARFAATNIALGYNKTPVINLDGSNGTINIYRLPTIDANTKKVTKAGALGMQLGASSLNFYEPPVGNANPTIAATLSSTGLNIVDGSITLGSTFSVNRNGELTATAGSIGGFTIGTNVIKNTKTSYSETTNNGVWLGTDGIGLGKGLFYVTNAGVLTAKSGTIGGWNISATALCSATTYSPGSGRILLAPAGVASSATGNLPAATYAITAGTNFGVTTAGTLYATGAEISGKITVGAGSNVYTTDDVNPLEIGGRNLAKRENVIAQSTAYTEENHVYTGNYGAGGGLKFPSSMFTVGKSYVLSFKFQKVSGTLTAMGGHSAGFTCNGYYIDGDKKSQSYMAGVTVSDDTAIHEVVVFLTYNGNTSDNNLYIQPNRPSYTSGNTNAFKIWDIQIENGNKATDWSPAPEDLDVHKYVTSIDNDNGIKIHAVNNTSTKYVKINADGMQVYIDSTDNPAASFGSSVQIGKSDNINMLLSSTGTNIKNVNTSLFNLQASVQSTQEKNTDLVTFTTLESVNTSSHTAENIDSSASNIAVNFITSEEDVVLESSNYNLSRNGNNVIISLTNTGVTTVTNLMKITPEGESSQGEEEAESDETEGTTIIPGTLYISYTISIVNTLIDTIGKINTIGEGRIIEAVNLGNNQTEAFITAINSGTGKGVSLGVGAGGNNRGLYDNAVKKWVIYKDASNKTAIVGSNFNVTASGKVTNTYSIHTSYAGSVRHRVQNTNKSNAVIDLIAATDGSVGLYEIKRGRYLIRTDKNNNVRIRGGAFIIPPSGAATLTRSLELKYGGDIILTNHTGGIQGRRASGSDTYTIGFVSDNNNVVIGDSDANLVLRGKNRNSSYDYIINPDGDLQLKGNVVVQGYLRGVGTTTTTSSVNARTGTGSGSEGRIFRATDSSKRYKHDIQDLTINFEKTDLNPSRLYDIRIRKFKYNDDYLSKDDLRSNVDVPGFIAEEVYNVYPIAVDLNENGEPENWNIRFIIPPMLALIQQQKKQIDELEKRVAELEK